MDLLQGLDTVSVLIITLTVAGVVELVKRAYEKDIRSIVTIIGASVAGAIITALVGGNYLAGFAFGLSASGLVTLAGYTGVKLVDDASKSDDNSTTSKG